MLTIAKVSRKDAGLYECAAANTLGTAISSCTLAVARKDVGGDLGGQGMHQALGIACWGLALAGGTRLGTAARLVAQPRGWGRTGAGHSVSALHPGFSRGPRCCCTGVSPWVPACPVCPPAGLPGRPGTPEIAQKYKNTVLVLWKPAESKAPCTYTLERRLEGTWPVKEWPHAAWGHPLAGLQALPLHGWVLGAWGSVLGGGDRRLRPASPAP